MPTLTQARLTDRGVPITTRKAKELLSIAADSTLHSRRTRGIYLEGIHWNRPSGQPRGDIYYFEGSLNRWLMDSPEAHQQWVQEMQQLLNPPQLG
jgi:hypothetical protein